MGCRQDADGAGASNQHILRQEVEGQGGMGGIAEGIKDGVQLLRNLGGAGNDVGGGNYQVLCEGAVPVDADARGVFTQVPPAGAAVTAHAADDVPLAGDQLAQVMSLYGGAISTISPTYSCPAVVPTRKVFCAHSFQSQMCTSVPQMAVL